MAALIFAGRNRPAIPFVSVEELLDSLADLTTNRTPATAATRLGSKTVGGGVSAGSARRGSVFIVVGQEKKLKLADAWHWKDENKDYGQIMTILDKQGGFGQNRSDPAFYIRFPTLEERRAARDKFARECLNCGEDAHFARDCRKPFMRMFQLRVISMLDLATQQKEEKKWENGKQG